MRKFIAIALLLSLLTPVSSEAGFKSKMRKVGHAAAVASEWTAYGMIVGLIIYARASSTN